MTATLPSVARLLIAEAADALARVDDRPRSWLELREPPRFPQLVEEHGATLTGWVLPGTPVESKTGCGGPFVWPIRLRWLVCHPGWDENGYDRDARDEAAERVLTGAQAVERALASYTCGRTPDGVQSWRITDARAVPPAGMSAGWEWTVRTVQ